MASVANSSRGKKASSIDSLLKKTEKNITPKIIEEQKIETKSVESEEKIVPKKETLDNVVEPKKDARTQKQEYEALFGKGFTIDEYERLTEIFNTYLNNYPLKTANHKMALIKVCKCTLRYDQSIADNDLDAMKIWDSALSKALKEAKINPEQLSAADLSDGISSFSKISEAIEKVQDIIPVLPHFRQGPQDMIDYAIWQYVNYCRRLTNMPTVKYADLYAFMEEQYNANKKDLDFLKLDKNGNYDETDGEDL